MHTYFVYCLQRNNPWPQKSCSSSFLYSNHWKNVLITNIMSKWWKSMCLNIQATRLMGAYTRIYYSVDLIAHILVRLYKMKHACCRAQYVHSKHINIKLPRQGILSIHACMCLYIVYVKFGSHSPIYVYLGLTRKYSAVACLRRRIQNHNNQQQRTPHTANMKDDMIRIVVFVVGVVVVLFSHSLDSSFQWI